METQWSRKEPIWESIWIWAAAGVVVLAGLAAATYFYQRGLEPVATETADTEPNPATRAATDSSGLAPRSADLTMPRPTEPPVPLPPLDESDEQVKGFLSVFFGAEPIEQLLIPTRIVRNTVVTIDNLARDKVALQQRPVQATPGKFLVAGAEEMLVLAPENYARYRPLVRLVESADTKTIVALYRRLYPLLREAYEDLGHQDGNFNIRVLEVIEHLLATPEVEGPIRLVQPTVLYQYADEELEARSPGQKLLIRMGPENARIIKQKLREIRDELV